MSVAERNRNKEAYFARVAPLLGEGLSRHAVRVDAGAEHVAELLASCRLRSLPGAPNSVRAALTWRNGFEDFDFAARAPDVTVTSERGDVAAAAWSERAVKLTLPAHPILSRFVSNAVARELRDALLGRAPWPAGERFYGDPRWPFAVASEPATVAAAAAPRHVLVVGAGSVGSEVARLLSCSRLTLVDAARVSVFNPQRQWFSTNEIGAFKVEALRDRLPNVRSVPVAADASLLAELIARDRPDVCVLATGTHHTSELARVLWRHDVPFVACCAYPQARFFEVLVCDPRERTPCYECFRGHLYRGVESRPVVADEVSSFLYRQADAQTRDAAYKDLVAEPASAIETGRVADVATVCALELGTAKSPWLTRMIAEGTTCLIGGNTVDLTANGDAAYGITRPGQVVRVGLDDLVGDEHNCGTCARKLRPAHRLQRETLSAVAEDAAMLLVTSQRPVQASAPASALKPTSRRS